MREMARLVTERLPEVTWQTEARFEKSLTPEFVSTLKKGGCRQLSFGFESASQRVLNLMNKSNVVEEDRKILISCAENGIAVNLQTFIGFPTESRDEAGETITFLIENERYIASIGFGIFTLFRDTPVHKEPQKFGIADISPIETLYGACTYRPLAGMTGEEIEKEHKSALEQINPIYKTRTFYLSKAMGAHSLLQFSHYPYDAISRIWQSIDAPHWADESEMGDIIPEMSPNLIMSYPPDTPVLFKCRVVCRSTGDQFFLAPDEKRLLFLCDGTISIDEITSLWVKEQTQDFERSIVVMAHAYATMREFLRKGLVRAGGAHASLSSA
jgi:hypothetical protein